MFGKLCLAQFALQVDIRDRQIYKQLVEMINDTFSCVFWPQTLGNHETYFRPTNTQWDLQEIFRIGNVRVARATLDLLSSTILPADQGRTSESTMPPLMVELEHEIIFLVPK
jgi:hypothetical protein